MRIMALSVSVMLAVDVTLANALRCPLLEVDMAGVFLGKHFKSAADPGRSIELSVVCRTYGDSTERPIVEDLEATSDGGTQSLLLFLLAGRVVFVQRRQKGCHLRHGKTVI
jgi:hypothetical protein